MIAVRFVAFLRIGHSCRLIGVVLVHRVIVVFIFIDIDIVVVVATPCGIVVVIVVVFSVVDY